jgi:hypothetical protein
MTRPILALGFAALVGAALLSACHKSQAGAAATRGPASRSTQAAPSDGPTGTGLQPVSLRQSSAMTDSDPCPSIGTIAETRGGRIAMTAGKVVRLATVCPAEAMTAHLRTYGSGMRYLLVADDLRAGVQPGVLFRLSLGPPSTGEAAVLGTLSFFSARQPSSAGPPHSISYDVTREVQGLAVAGWPPGGLGIAISPSGAVAPGTDASIGAIRLVAQGGR